MNSYYRKELQNTYLVLQESGEVPEDYQIQMLQENQVKGILPIHINYIDNQSHYQYAVDGKQSLKEICENTKLCYEMIRKLVRSLQNTIAELKKYMLSEEKMLLAPEYIFMDQQQFWFCYYPPAEHSSLQSFHELTEFFVREVDYHDEKGVHLAYTLHKASMEPNYSVKEIMDAFPKEKHTPEICYEEKMEKQAEVVIPIAEKPEFWEPVKRLLERRKKSKWGIWDQIHIEENDL